MKAHKQRIVDTMATMMRNAGKAEIRKCVNCDRNRARAFAEDLCNKTKVTKSAVQRKRPGSCSEPSTRVCVNRLLQRDLGDCYST